MWKTKKYFRDLRILRSLFLLFYFWNTRKRTLNKLSDLDIGQSIVIQQQNVIGIECFEGTEKLIERCSKLKYKYGEKPILIKLKKINQTRKADLPTVGPDTIEQLYKAGFSGLVVDAENCLVLSVEKLIDLSNGFSMVNIHGLFSSSQPRSLLLK